MNQNFESHNSLKLNFTNIPGPCSNFVGCESFFKLNSPDALALCKTSFYDSIGSSSSSLGFIFLQSKGILQLICIVLQFTWRELLLYVTYLEKTLRIPICVFNWFYFIQCLTCFSSIDYCLYQLLSLFLMLHHLT